MGKQGRHGCGKCHDVVSDIVNKEVIKSVSTETLLKELIDRGVIHSWYYNGSYHVGSELSKKE